MNDGDYPRRSMRNDFDLMGMPGTARPGDRARRDDDRQLMLEALLSARRVLYVSWCGHSVRDNSAQPPSVLVSQLRDYLAAGWTAQTVSERTTQHPLQPFSRRYFETDHGLLTYAREWRTAHATTQSDDTTPLPPLAAFTPTPENPLSLNQLTNFLRKPVKAFFRQRLQVVFDDSEQDPDDDECFALDGLQEYTLINDLLASALAQTPVQGMSIQAQTAHALSNLRKAGQLPLKSLGDRQQQALQNTVTTMLQAWQDAQHQFSEPAPRHSVRVALADVVLQDWVDQLRHAPCQTAADAPTAWLELSASHLLSPSKKPVARTDKLLAVWVRSLATAASGLQARGLVVGRDGVLNISPMPQDVALQTLHSLLGVWQQGMNAPLPLPPKTALAWLKSKTKQVRADYEGGFSTHGDVSEPCMARIYPDFEALTADGRFVQLAQQVYQPLLDWANQHVFASSHASDLASTQDES
jgi:exodeoxyribonuclease V gamma subunit